MERKKYFDYLRVFAALSVVVLHVSANNFYSPEIDVNGIEWQTFNFYNSISRWGVAIFVMISGSLFLEREVPVNKIYSKYILRLAVAYVFWSMFYAVVTEDTFNNGIVHGIKSNIGSIAAGHYHMWFVLLMIGIYMCIPIFKKIVADEKIMRYFLIVSFAFTFLIPWIIQIINDFIAYRSEEIQNLVGYIDAKLTAMNMNLVVGYSFYVVLGYYLDRIHLEKKKRIIIYILGIIGAAFTVFANRSLALRTQYPSEVYYGNFTLNVLFMVIAIHTLFKYHNFNSTRADKIACTLSKLCFGEYMIHAFFIDILYWGFHFNSLSFDSRLSVPVITVIVFCISFLASAILSRIPIIRKYCI